MSNARRARLGPLPDRTEVVYVSPLKALAVDIARTAFTDGETLVYHLGGWQPPLGLALTANTTAALMIAGVAVVVCDFPFR